MNAISTTPYDDQAADSDWRKSTFCNPSNNCLEVKDRPGGGVALRHSQHQGITIELSQGEWNAFLRGVYDGQFDRHLTEAAAPHEVSAASVVESSAGTTSPS